RRSRMTRRFAPPPLYRLAVAACLLTMCGSVGCFPWVKPSSPWDGRQPLAADLTRDELVRHINDQTARTPGWRCRSMTVQVANYPKASGQLAVEYPRKMRLKARAMIPVADFGSNADRVWCWVNPKIGGPGPETLTCRHASFDRVRCAAEQSGGVQIPFDPDWMMEVLGVAPIDPRSVSLTKAPDGGPLWHLTSHRTDAGGRRVLRVIDVDARYGQVLAHELRDANTGRPLVRAELQDHRRCEETGAVLPHEIHITWPASRLPKMTLRLNEIEVNPRDLPDDLWSLPAGRGGVRHLDGGTQLADASADPHR
ncbi:MAG: hypothetical protein AAF907_08650, partial [Planctomycetota bacterium]